VLALNELLLAAREAESGEAETQKSEGRGPRGAHPRGGARPRVHRREADRRLRTARCSPLNDSTNHAAFVQYDSRGISAKRLGHADLLKSLEKSGEIAQPMQVVRRDTVWIEMHDVVTNIANTIEHFTESCTIDRHT